MAYIGKDIPEDFYTLLDFCDGSIEKLYYKTQFLTGKLTIHTKIIKKHYVEFLLQQGKSYKDIEEELELSKSRISIINKEMKQRQKQKEKQCKKKSHKSKQESHYALSLF